MQEINPKPKAKNVVRGKINRPDTPLATSPEPYGDFNKSAKPVNVIRGKINK